MIKGRIHTLLAIIIPVLIISSAYANTVLIHKGFVDFDVINDEGLLISGLKENGEINEEITGDYTFRINGFNIDLKFEEGTAKLPINLDLTGVLYINYIDAEQEINKLYYSKAGFVLPIAKWLIWFIPLLVIFLALILKRLIILILIIGFVMFFVMQGMELTSFIEMMIETVKGFFV